MKKYLLSLVLLFTILTGKSNATTVCGGTTGQQTLDVSGAWSYSWVVSPGVTWHGTLNLTGCSGYVTGYVGLPAEVTDPNQVAAWNMPILGTENGTSVMLMGLPGNDGPWYFELVQALQNSHGNLKFMSGAEFAGTGHLNRNATFSATFNGSGRSTTTGVVTPCPMSNPLNVTGNYNYQWGPGWSGTMTVNQTGPWVWAQINAPTQLPPDQRATWNWPLWGGIMNSVNGTNIFFMSAPGVNFGDPWWFDFAIAGSGNNTYMASNGYAYACHSYQDVFTAINQLHQ